MVRRQTENAVQSRPVRLRPALLAAAAALVVMGLMVIFAQQEQAREIQARRLAAVEFLSTEHARIEGLITASHEGLKSLAKLEAAFGDLTSDQFDVLAAALIDDQPHVRNIALSRGSVIEFVYPLAGNEPVLGVDYRDLPESQWPAYDRAMTTGEALLAGPVDLLQGDRAVILRIPVRESAAQDARATGMVSAPLMLDGLLEQVGLNDGAQGYDVAIRGADALGHEGAPVYGDQTLFDRDPELMTLGLPGGSWQLAAVPRAGWDALAPVTLNLLIVGFGLSCIAAYMTYRGAVMAQERNAQRHTLALSEQRFKDFAETASDGFWETGPDLRLTQAKGTFFEATDPKGGSLVGRTPLEASCYSDSPEWTEHLATLEAHKPFTNVRLSMEDATGRRRWISVGGRPLHTPDGAFAGYRGTVRDLTDLVESEQRNSAIIAAALDAVVSIDAEGRVLEFNPAAEAMFGYSRAELLGKPMANFLVPKAMRAAHAAGLARMAAGGEGRIIDSRVTLPALRKDGSEFSAEVAITRSSHGEELGFTAYLRDVTESERAQRALVASEQRYRTMIGSLSEGIIVHGRDGRIVSANPRAAEILGAPWEVLVTTPSPPPEWNALREDGTPMPHEEFPPIVTLRTGRPCRDAVVGITGPDGELRWLSVNAEPILDAEVDADEVVISSFFDITEQRRAEENLRQAQKMEAVGQLTGGIAHDFNNLLAVMLGNLELLEDRLADPKQGELLRSVLRAVEHGADLTGRLLAFSRHAPLSPKVTDLGELIDGMRPMLQTTLRSTITLEIEAAPDARPVLIDRSQLESALLNLAINARDAMPAGGSLTVTAQNVDLDAEAVETAGLEPGRYVAVTVADTGTGMTDEVKAHMFEPFFTTKDVGQGSGLGLSMVYGFVRQSGGGIEIDTAPDQGTRVHLYLPESAGEIAENVELPANARRGRGEPILVVEDQVDVRELVVGMLETLGYKAHGVAEGPAALEYLESGAEVALMLTDVILTGTLSGPEMAVRARTLRPGLKVVFMSGYPRGSFGDNDALTREPLLTKPFRKADFARRISEALAAGRG